MSDMRMTLISERILKYVDTKKNTLGLLGNDTIFEFDTNLNLFKNFLVRHFIYMSFFIYIILYMSLIQCLAGSFRKFSVKNNIK